MTPGDWHNLNGYRFQETEHGPMILTTCVDCGDQVLIVQAIEGTVPTTTPRCSDCGRRYHGL